MQTLFDFPQPSAPAPAPASAPHAHVTPLTPTAPHPYIGHPQGGVDLDPTWSPYGYAARVVRLDGHLIGTGDEGHTRTPERTALIQRDLLELAQHLDPRHNHAYKGHKIPPTSNTTGTKQIYSDFSSSRSPIYLIERGRVADAHVAIHIGSTCPACRARGTVSVNISHTGHCVVNADDTVTIQARPGFLGGWTCTRCQAGDTGVPLTVQVTRGAPPTAPTMQR